MARRGAHGAGDIRPNNADGNLSPIEPSNLRTTARAAIRASIITGQLRPGAIYPVSYFASRLGVSSTPVREALLDLLNQGLVELARNKGFRVPDVSEHDLNEIYQLRLLVEVSAITSVVGRLSDADAADCRELAQKTEACAKAGDLTGFLENDRLFHAALLSPLRNRRLIALLNGLRDQARLWALPALARTEPLTRSAREHTHLLHAIVRGDTADAEKIISHHLEHTRGLWAGKAED